MALKLECKYQDILLFFNGKRIPEPFCLVDMGICQETTLEVHIEEGAEVGLDRIRAIVEQEIAATANDEEGDEEEKE